MVLKTLRVIGTAGGCQCVAWLRVPEDSPVTMRDFSSFENSGAMRQSPEAPATTKMEQAGIQKSGYVYAAEGGVKEVIQGPWENPKDCE